MASLTNTKISDTYPLLLKIETNGVDGTLRSIEDGDGTTSALQISTGAINVSGTITASGNVDFNGDLDVDGTTNLDDTDIDGTLTVDGSRSGDFLTKLTSTNQYGLYIKTTGTTSSHDLLRLDDNSGTVFKVMATGATTVSGTLNSGAITQDSGVLTIKNAPGDSNGLRIFQDTSDASKIYNHYNGTLQLGVGNTTALTIDSSENSTFAGDVFVSTGDARLGVGVTSIPHWGSGFDVLSVGHSSQYACETADGADRNVFWTNNLYYDGTGTYGYARHYTDEASMIQQRAGTIRFFTDASGTADADFNPSERMRIDSSGNVGIGTTSPAVRGEIKNAASGVPATSGTTQTNGVLRLSSTQTTGIIDIGMNGSAPWIQATDSGGLNNNYSLLLNPNGGNVGIGDTSPTSDSGFGTPVLSVKGSTFPALAIKNSTSGGEGIVSTGNAAGLQLAIAGNATASDNYIIFRTGNTNSNYNSTERMRITSGGQILFGKTSTSGAVAGGRISTSSSEFTVLDGTVVYFNRQNTDGTIVDLRQGDASEGTISVSGSTVSYNGFSGNHESSGIPTNTAIGTVVSTIDELDVYPNTNSKTGEAHSKAGETRADHAKIKVSDSVGDRRVYGVLSSFNEDNKPIVASVGIGSVKVTGACAGGDLLESNGDGTAKVQDDDIIRSKTIGKVTIGDSDTSVKLVSCVLYCG